MRNLSFRRPSSPRGIPRFARNDGPKLSLSTLLVSRPDSQIVEHEGVDVRRKFDRLARTTDAASGFLLYANLRAVVTRATTARPARPIWRRCASSPASPPSHEELSFRGRVLPEESAFSWLALQSRFLALLGMTSCFASVSICKQTGLLLTSLPFFRLYFCVFFTPCCVFKVV